MWLFSAKAVGRELTAEYCLQTALTVARNVFIMKGDSGSRIPLFTKAHLLTTGIDMFMEVLGAASPGRFCGDLSPLLKLIRESENNYGSVAATGLGTTTNICCFPPLLHIQDSPHFQHFLRF